MRQILRILFLCLFPFSVVLAQSSASQPLLSRITGTVMDSATHVLLSYATVMVQEKGSVRPGKGVLTNENGFFEIKELITHKHYQLRLTCTGYQVKTIDVSFNSSTLDLGQLPLISLSKQLEEVQIVSQKPLMEQDVDKLVYHADADPDSKTSSVLDILRKIPLVYIDADDNLQLNGNSNYRVLINGKSSSLFLNNQNDLFRNLPATAIKTIEIITIPPSRYEAQGVGGIINITTFKKNLGGYNGGLTIRGSDPYYLSLNGNLTASLGKFGFYGGIGYQKNVSPANSSFFSRKDKLQQTLLEQVGINNSNSKSQNVSGEISYQLNSQNLITAGLGRNTSNGSSDYIQEVILFNASRAPAEAYHYLNAGNNTQCGHDINLDFQHSSKKNNAQVLTFSYKWSNSSDENTSEFALQPVVNYKERQSLSQNADRSNEQVMKVDFVQPIRKHTLEFGASAVCSDNHSRYFYENKDTTTGNFVPDTIQSNQFDYKEKIYSVYTSLDLKMGKWRLRTGGRLEQARINAHFISSGTLAIQNYSNLIPTITLSRQLKEASRISLSYTQRIDRPNLYYLDPYVDRTNPWNISYGNPELHPAVAHVFNLSYSVFKKVSSLNTTVSHYFINNAIQSFTILGPDTIARTTFGNIGSSQNLSFSIGFNTTLFKILSLILNGSTNSVKYVTTINGKAFTTKGFTYQVSGSANLRLKNWRVGSTIGYNAPNLFLQGRTASYISNNIMLNKYFLKNNRANIGLWVTSPFREYRRSFTEIDDPAFLQLRESNTLVRRFTVMLSYRFSKVQASN